jgi:hypothetical protein
MWQNLLLEEISNGYLLLNLLPLPCCKVTSAFEHKYVCSSCLPLLCNVSNCGLFIIQSFTVTHSVNFLWPDMACRIKRNVG